MIVNCVAYRDGKRLADIPLAEIGATLADPGTFLWLGLHEVEPEVLLHIQEQFGLHELAVEDARKARQRSRIEAYGDTLFIAIKTAQLSAPGAGDTAADGDIHYGETHFFVARNFLISVRHGNDLGYAAVRRRCEDAPEMLAKGAPFALYALIDFIVDNYHPIVEALSSEFEVLESEIFTHQLDHTAIERLYGIKRKLMALRSAVVPVEDISVQLTRLHPELIHKDLRAYFRDIHDHVARTIETLDNLREMLTTAMAMNLSLISVRQNDIVKRLAGWGAILAVPTVVFSLYGMNFHHMPELTWEFGYPGMIVATLVICGLFHRKLKKSGWL
jgi:magnesium transporter